MTSIKNVYEYKPPSGAAPKQMVILLHGVGANGRDLLSLAPLWAQQLPETVFISPDAPFACDMVPPGYPDSYQWFSLRDWSHASMLRGLQQVQPILDSFIAAQLEKYDLPASKLALMGFSQGTMTSLFAGPRYPEKIAGILGYSGALVWEPEVDAAALQKIPVELIHGESDDVVPVSAYHQARQVLQQSGFDVGGFTIPGLAHGIEERGIASGGQFLKRVFSN